MFLGPYNLANWYWFVGGDLTQVYSSASGTFVPVADATFQAWKAANDNNVPLNVDTVAALANTLANYGLTPTDPTVLDAYKGGQLNHVDVVILKVLFNHENRIRTLASQPTITFQQFLAALKSVV